MGIKRLAKYIRENLSAEFDGRIFQEGDELLIDGPGFAFWVCRSGGLPGGEAYFPSMIAAYEKLDAAIRRNVLLLLQSGLKVNFFLDSNVNRVLNGNKERAKKLFELECANGSEKIEAEVGESLEQEEGGGQELQAEEMGCSESDVSGVSEEEDVGEISEDEEEHESSIFKTFTRAKRNKQKMSEWETVKMWCTDGAIDSKEARLPLAPLFMEQFKSTLHSLYQEVNRSEDGSLYDEDRMTITLCKGEADQYLAMECARKKKGDNEKFVIGEDSDFLLYQGCNYVAFHDLTLIGGTSDQLNVKVYTPRVWRNDKLPLSLGLAPRLSLDDEDELSEAEKDLCQLRLCEFAALLGNDYTSHISYKKWDFGAKDKSTSLAIAANDDGSDISKDQEEGIEASDDTGLSMANVTDCVDTVLVTHAQTPPGKSRMKSPSLLSEWLGKQPRSWKLKATSESDQIALEYSHASYCLDVRRTKELEKKANDLSYGAELRVIEIEDAVEDDFDVESEEEGEEGDDDEEEGEKENEKNEKEEGEKEKEKNEKEEGEKEKEKNEKEEGEKEKEKNEKEEDNVTTEKVKEEKKEIEGDEGEEKKAKEEVVEPKIEEMSDEEKPQIIKSNEKKSEVAISKEEVDKVEEGEVDSVDSEESEYSYDFSGVAVGAPEVELPDLSSMQAYKRQLIENKFELTFLADLTLEAFKSCQMKFSPSSTIVVDSVHAADEKLDCAPLVQEAIKRTSQDLYSFYSSYKASPLGPQEMASYESKLVALFPPVTDAAAIETPPPWKDMVASYQYQCLCKALIGFSSPMSCFPPLAVEPRFLFNDRLFFNHLKELRDLVEKQNKSLSASARINNTSHGLNSDNSDGSDDGDISEGSNELFRFDASLSFAFDSDDEEAQVVESQIDEMISASLGDMSMDDGASTKKKRKKKKNKNQSQNDAGHLNSDAKGDDTKSDAASKADGSAINSLGFNNNDDVDSDNSICEQAILQNLSSDFQRVSIDTLFAASPTHKVSSSTSLITTPTASNASTKKKSEMSNQTLSKGTNLQASTAPQQDKVDAKISSKDSQKTLTTPMKGDITSEKKSKKEKKLKKEKNEVKKHVVNKLPIENHETEICDHVARHRVTIIHGETGCGKSSTVPVMLMRSHDRAWEGMKTKAKQMKMLPQQLSDLNEDGLLPIKGYAKMFVTQPRRIAARSLCERVRNILVEATNLAHDKSRQARHIDKGVAAADDSDDDEDDCSEAAKSIVGLRLGHGERTTDTSSTRIWFATTGYVVLLLAHHPERFNDHSHLVLDEVHERSIDTDVLCLLARKLLHNNPTIKLVLMSATLAAALYQQYFGIPEPPLFVGVKRYPVKEVYPEDLAVSMTSGQKIFSQLAAQTCKGGERTQQVVNLQVEASVALVREIGVAGTSILIFVSGMAEIVEVCSRIEALVGGHKHYKVIPIHSELPDEEQAEAFISEAKMVKVLVATNVAESSITIPDCDNVICFGVHKQIEYNSAKHRTMLSPLWISKASAVQRAGRTGRVRPGTVYRLYSRHLFEKKMSEFDSGEMGRQPLDTVILGLRQMLNEKVVPILEQVLEPPPLQHIDRAFSALHEEGLLTSPDDDGDLTDLGSFVSKLGLDLRLGRLIGVGCMFGVLPEAVAMASVLSAPKSPFRVATELIQKDPSDYSEVVNTVMHARHLLDGGVLSEPLMLMNLLHIYRTSSNKNEVCLKYGLAHVRMRQINNSYTHLLTRICDVLRNEKSNKNFKGKDTSKLPPGKQQPITNRLGGGGTPDGMDIANASVFYESVAMSLSPNKSPMKKKNGKQSKKNKIVPSQILGKGAATQNHGTDEAEELVTTEEFYLKSLGPAKINILRILLVWIFHDQVICQRGNPDSLNIESMGDAGGTDQALVLKMTTDHKLPDIQSIYALLKTPYKLYHGSASEPESPVWKTCRYKIYYNEGAVVKKAIQAESAGFNQSHINLAKRLRLDFFFLIYHDLKQVFCWVSRQNKDMQQVLPKGTFQNISNVSHDKAGDSHFMISKLNQKLLAEIYRLLETHERLIIASLQSSKLEVMSRGQELYLEDLGMIFDTGNRLCFYERDEISKNYTLLCPLSPPKSEQEKKSSLKLFENLPLSVLILGQTTRPKFGQRSKLKVKNLSLSTDDQITEVAHNIPVPNWTALSGGNVMMDSHSLEAGSMCLNSIVSSRGLDGDDSFEEDAPNLTNKQKKQLRKEREAILQERKQKKKLENSLYAVAANMLDLKTGGSRCMGVSILPPGPDFLALSLATFGIRIPNNLLQNCKHMDDQLEEAMVFNDCCDRLGEKLCYQPELTKWLLKIFSFLPSDGDEEQATRSQNKAFENKHEIDVMKNFGYGSPYSRSDIIHPNGDAKERDTRGGSVVPQPYAKSPNAAPHKHAYDQGVGGGGGGGGAMDDIALLTQLWESSQIAAASVAQVNEQYGNDWDIQAAGTSLQSGEGGGSGSGGRGGGGGGGGGDSYENPPQEMLWSNHLPPDFLNNSSTQSPQSKHSKPNKANVPNKPTQRLPNQNTAVHSKSKTKKSVSPSKPDDEEVVLMKKVKKQSKPKVESAEKRQVKETIEFNEEDEENILIHDFMVEEEELSDDSDINSDVGSVESDSDEEIVVLGAKAGSLPSIPLPQSELDCYSLTNEALKLALIAKGLSDQGSRINLMKRLVDTFKNNASTHSSSAVAAAAAVAAQPMVTNLKSKTSFSPPPPPPPKKKTNSKSADSKGVTPGKASSKVSPTMKEVSSPSPKQGNEKVSRQEVLDRVKVKGEYLKEVQKTYCNDFEVVLTAVKQNAVCYEFASPKLKQNPVIVLETATRAGLMLGRFPDNLKTTQIVLAAIQQSKRAVKFIPESLYNDRKFVVKAVKVQGLVLKDTALEFREDFNIVSDAVKNNPEAFLFASDTLKANSKIAKLAVQGNWRMLEHVLLKQPDGNLINFDVICKAVEQNAAALQFVPAEILDTKFLVMQLVNINGTCLSYASEKLKEDKGIVAAAALSQSQAAQ